ncbi:MAG TPA: hypothetical protein PJ995_21065 [Cyclobacteriaceae bacterium]|nr:hypothetical protein [Cyclobacteriaceae bacterium]HNA14751.1 hypothetical protein [Cyclobacteriaceae bacterium]
MISLIHPSRGRPELAHKTAKKWIQSAGVEVEHILSLDTSDAQLGAYTAIDLQCISDNSNVVQATNTAAKKALGDILVYLSDDFDCFDNWGVAIENEVKNFGPLWLLKVDDCLQKFDVPVLTIPIMSRGLYNRLGYFWYPEYRSMFCDEDLYWTCRKLGVIRNAPHLKFEHKHASVGKAPDDETYRRSAKNWDQGKELFNKRKGLGFPV